MSKWDWAHLDLFIKNQIGHDQTESNYTCMLCLLFNCFAMFECYNLDIVSWVTSCHGLSFILNYLIGLG